MANPALGIITSIGREHLEFFGDLNGVIEEEGTLAELLPDDGKLFLNFDTPGAAAIARRSRAPVVTAGLSSGSDWRAANLRMDDRGVQFDCHCPRQEFTREFCVPLLGRHHVINTLLAMAVAAELGVTPEQVQRGLAACAPPKMRLQLWETGGIRVLDDTYNANADSMRAALDTLRDLPSAGRRIAVLGDMAELGAHGPGAHAEIGRYSASVGIDHLMTVGKMAGVTADAARAAGLNAVAEFGDVESAVEALRSLLRPGDLVLLKASRAMALERVGEALRREKPDAPGN
jgi:UDP-N-acetylmuramoyl-tripeptide--D-alanyl-D-alanine ligase